MLISGKLVRLSLVCLWASLTLPVSPALGQEATPRLTEYGHPNLQGLWANPFQTPLERPIELGDKRIYSAEEAEVLRSRVIAIDLERQAPINLNRAAPGAGANLNNQADGNFEIMPIELAKISGAIHTSLMSSPASGRISWQEAAGDIHLGVTKKAIKKRKGVYLSLIFSI